MTRGEQQQQQQQQQQQKEPFWWRLHFGSDVFLLDDRRAQLAGRLSDWCRSESIQDLAANLNAAHNAITTTDNTSRHIPGAEQVRRGWRGVNDGNSHTPFASPLPTHVMRTRTSSSQNLMSPSSRHSYAIVFDLMALLSSALEFDNALGCDLNAALTYQPDEAINCIGAAVCSAVFGSVKSHINPQAMPLVFHNAARRVSVRLINVRVVISRMFSDDRSGSGGTSCTSIGAIRASSVGRLVCITGVVTKASPIRAMGASMDFSCSNCGAIGIGIDMKDGRFTPPDRCPGNASSSNGNGSGRCRGKFIVPIRNSLVCVDWQGIRVQELQNSSQSQANNTISSSYAGTDNDDGNGSGRIPSSLDCELREGLVDQAATGDTVRLVGIVKTAELSEGSAMSRRANDQATGKNKGMNGTASGSACMYSLYLDVNSVEVISNATGGNVNGDNTFQQSDCQLSNMQIETGHNKSSFSALDLKFIARFAQEHSGDALRQLVHSLCPSIIGHEIVKAGMILAIVGGVQKNKNSGNCVEAFQRKPDEHVTGNDCDSNASKESGVERIQVRGDVHMLVVGDPGIGKSQMLKAVKESSPRGIYLCGNGTTSAGLTASVGKASGSGKGRGGGYYHVEAGALVMADRGVCCVDEFDKLSADHSSLLEAMEQQSVSLAKAGVFVSLPARTSVIAAANPVKGHYDRARTVNENIKLSNAMLSRFDLVFVLIDEPDDKNDQNLSEHLLALHSGDDERTRRALRKRNANTMALPSTAGPNDKHSKPLLLEGSHKHMKLGQQWQKSNTLSRNSVYHSSFSSTPSLQANRSQRNYGSENDSQMLPFTNPETRDGALPSFVERLKLRAHEIDDFCPLPKKLIRTYIAYVRQYVFPTLSEEAKTVLKEFYLELRSSARPIDGTPITVCYTSFTSPCMNSMKKVSFSFIPSKSLFVTVSVNRTYLCVVFECDKLNLGTSTGEHGPSI